MGLLWDVYGIFVGVHAISVGIHGIFVRFYGISVEFQWDWVEFNTEQPGIMVDVTTYYDILCVFLDECEMGIDVVNQS